LWQSFDNGRTIGKSGSEAAVILLDETHLGSARITLERGGFAPFAITLGHLPLDGAHTLFHQSRRARVEPTTTMKQALDSIQSIPLNSDRNATRRWKPPREWSSNSWSTIPDSRSLPNNSSAVPIRC
jgi:hypothetical protein